MKTKFLFLLCFVAVLFAACNLDSESNYTPAILIGPFIHNGDTLKFYPYSSVLKDTISVGDTVFITVYVSGQTSNLINLSITESQDGFTKIIFPPVDSLIIFPERTPKESIFALDSNHKNGNFKFSGELIYLEFVLKYIAQKASNEAFLRVSVTSDAKPDYNLSSFKVITPIKEAATTP